MKRYNDMTEEELVALSEEEVQKLIDLEFAHEGIIPVDNPEEPILKEIDVQPVDVAYSCSGVYFENIEDAQKFQEMKRFRNDYDYKTGCEYRYLKPQDTYDDGVKKEMFYKKSDLDTVLSQIQENKRREDTYTCDKNKYDEFIKETTAIRDNVYDSIREADQRLYELEKAKKLYEKHKELADGNIEIAEKFFRDAYKDNQDIIDKVLNIND